MPTNATDNIYSTEYEDTGVPIPSTKIGYDNTESGLEADNVQEAIDELDSKIKAADEASEISYDNTDSGLSAENVQAAIDEVESKYAALEGRTIKIIEYVDLTGLTTYPLLKAGIKAAIQALIAAQPSDERLVIEGLNIPGNGYFLYKGSSYAWASTSSTTYITTDFFKTDVAADSVIIETMGESACRKATVGNGTLTVSDYTVDHLSDTIAPQIRVMRLKPV